MQFYSSGSQRYDETGAARANDDEATSETRQTRARVARRAETPGVAKTGFLGPARTTQQNEHIISPAALEPEALPMQTVLLHEPLDVALRQRWGLLSPADVRRRTHGLHVPISAADINDRFYLRRSLDVVLDLLSSICIRRLLRAQLVRAP